MRLFEMPRPAAITTMALAQHPRVRTGPLLKLETSDAVSPNTSSPVIARSWPGSDAVERGTSLRDVELNDRELAKVVACAAQSGGADLGSSVAAWAAVAHPK